jgi:fructose-1,6-bisphosphatase/inositol monophosphatase family enzyme
VGFLKDLLYTIADEVEKITKNLVSQGNPEEDMGMGADGTPTKLIDDAAEKACIRIVEQQDEKLNILSEECGFLDNSAEYTLVMDPIDGTHNAIRRIPFYSLSLAVGKKKLSDVKYGIVRNLVSGDTYWAEKGKGAFFNDKPLKIKPFEQKDSLFSIYVGRHATPRTYKVANIPRRARAIGCASLEMCLVAQGAFDVYFLNYQPSKYAMRVVDIAASTLILREAGGEVFNDTYDILDMNFELKARANVIAVGDLKALEYLKNQENILGLETNLEDKK